MTASTPANDENNYKHKREQYHWNDDNHKQSAICTDIIKSWLIYNSVNYDTSFSIL